MLKYFSKADAKTSRLLGGMYAFAFVIGPSPLLAQSQSADIFLCGREGCLPTNTEYADRLRSAYNVSLTTDAQRAKMKQFVANQTQGNVTDWKTAAEAYFSWKNGEAYSLSYRPASSGTRPNYDALRTTIETRIKDRLVDPDSARFKWPYEFMQGEWRTPKKYSGLLTCGMVNSRNRMGGYAGDSWFVVVTNNGQVSYLDIDSSVGPGLNADLCSRAAGRFQRIKASNPIQGASTSK